MRIIAGQARGRRLKSPTGHGTRPTSDRVREALFSILGPPAPTTRVLDLFAGAGGLGLEALSRGAAHAVFVDRDRAALDALRANVAALGFGDSADIIATESLRYLRNPPKSPFDWVFVDPPYALDLASKALAELARGPWLSPDAIVIVEHDRRMPPTAPDGLERAEPRRYGDTVLSLYRRSQP